MPTFIDQLVVELGLDASKYRQGQNEAMAQLKTLREESEKSGKQIESEGTKINEFFGRVQRGALGLLGALFAGRGVKEFTQYITTMDAATSRLSRTLGMSAEELSTWQGVARRTGGSVESISGAMQGLTDKLNTFMLTVQGGSFIPIFNNLGISVFDAQGKLKTAAQLFLDVNHAVQSMDPARARALLLLLGMDPSTINTLITNEATLRKMVDDQKQIAQTTAADAKAAEDLARAWSETEQSAESFGRKLLNIVSPALLTVLRTMTGLFRQINNPNQDKTGTDYAELSAGGFYFPQGANASGGTGAIPAAGAAVRSAAVEGYIREAAIKRGIDPDVAVAVAKSEGLNSYVGDKGTSFGPFQLHYKNNIPGLSNGGLGDVFTRQTGLDARDPATTKAQVDFALDEAAKSGWGAWHGWRGLPRAGLAGARPIGASGAASVSNNAPPAAGSTQTVTIGKVEVVTQAKDAEGIAADVAAALKRQNFGAQSNYGQQ